MSTNHKISRVTTKGILSTVPLPQKTDSYSPVPHKQVITLVSESLKNAGLDVLSERYLSARGGEKAMGMYNVGEGDKEMGMQLIWINSYDKSLPLKSAIGGQIFVCGNGVIRGDMGNFRRKHTGSVIEEFTESIKEYVITIGDHFKQLKRDRDRLKEIELSKRVCAELIGRMHIEEDILTATQVGIIKKELEHPTYDYNAEGSAWELYNHCTFSLKETHPALYVPSHENVHKFFVNEFELV